MKFVYITSLSITRRSWTKVTLKMMSLLAAKLVLKCRRIKKRAEYNTKCEDDYP